MSAKHCIGTELASVRNTSFTLGFRLPLASPSCCCSAAAPGDVLEGKPACGFGAACAVRGAAPARACRCSSNSAANTSS
eukprot:335764-Chlamydomonas_euryale.AAC.1